VTLVKDNLSNVFLVFFFGVFVKHLSGSKAHMLNFSLICLVILNMIHSIICPHSRWKQEFVFCFLLKHAEKKGKKGKNCAVVVVFVIFFWKFFIVIFFVMICKIDLNINLVKMALIIFISDEAIFVFGGQ